MDRFRELSAFIAVAEDGAFNGAARRLGLSPATLTRLINGLETRLGVRLFNRTTRRVALTDAGRRFRLDAEAVLQALSEAEATAAGAHAAPTGLLRVTAPVLFGERYMGPVLRDFLDAHPAMRAELLLLDRPVDLIEEGIDVALRIGELPDSTLIARRLGAVRRVTVAAPRYVEKNGAPHRVAGLKTHRIIHHGGAQQSPDWRYVAVASVEDREGAQAGGTTGRTAATARLQPTLTVNTLTAAIDAARSGWGITRCLSYQVSDDLASGALVEVLADRDDRQMPIHLLHSEGRQASAKTRAFVSFAAPRLRAAIEAIGCAAIRS